MIIKKNEPNFCSIKKKVCSFFKFFDLFTHKKNKIKKQ